MKKITGYCNGSNAGAVAKLCSATGTVKILRSQPISGISGNSHIISKTTYYDKIVPIVDSLNTYIDTMANKIVDITNDPQVYAKMSRPPIVSMDQIRYNSTNFAEV